jgi:hypothetical protein
MLRSPHDLRYVERIEGLRESCRTMVCLFDELWPNETASWRSYLSVARDFDCFFLNTQSSVDITKGVTQKPTEFIPFGVDSLIFCPYPVNPSRSIDVFSIGRRPAAMHQALLACSQRDGSFYVYDTVSNFSVIDTREHRSLLSQRIKRSRYFISYPAKFDQNPPAFELGSRYFEGAAGGAILVGMPPTNTTYERYFDWPDAVFPTPPDGSQIIALIADLDRQPERLARVRRDNVINSLLRHDWVYRWRQIQEHVGVPVSSGTLERQGYLTRLANQITNTSFS